MKYLRQIIIVVFVSCFISLILQIQFRFGDDSTIFAFIYSILYLAIPWLVPIALIYEGFKRWHAHKKKTALLLLFIAAVITVFYIGVALNPRYNPFPYNLNRIRTNIITRQCDYGGAHMNQPRDPWYYKEGCTEEQVQKLMEQHLSENPYDTLDNVNFIYNVQMLYPNLVTDDPLQEMGIEDLGLPEDITTYIIETNNNIDAFETPENKPTESEPLDQDGYYTEQAVTNKDVSICENVKKLKHLCIQQVAMELNDDSLCDTIDSAPIYISDCLTILAKQKQDASICERIQSPSLETVCINRASR